MPRIAPFFRALVCAAALMLLAGCGGYKVSGLVVEGPASGVYIVESNDRRLSDPGIAGASVQGVIDPDTLRRKPQGTVQTDSRGRFVLPISEVGAGLLEYKLGIFARAPGHAPAEDMFPLPSSGRKLLIVLPRGRDPGRAPEDYLEETVRQSKQMLEQGK